MAIIMIVVAGGWPDSSDLSETNLLSENWKKQKWIKQEKDQALINVFPLKV